MKADDSHFISQALRVINDAVICVIGMTDIHVRKTPLSKRLASRARSRIRALEKMLRRVIVLMALAMAGQVQSVPRMLARIRVIDGTPTKPLPPRKPKLPKAPAPSLPSYRAGASSFDFSALPTRNTSDKAVLHKLVKRIITLQRILKNPAPKVRRLAFYFSKLRKRGNTPPPPPEISLRRAPAELALVAGALSLELSRAMATWHNTS